MSFIGKWLGFDTEEICEEGLAALDRRDFEAAAEAFHACLDGDPKESTQRLTRFHLGECHAQLAAEAFRGADYDRAQHEIETSFAYAMPTAERLVLAARIARRLGDRRAATDHVERALARAPQHAEANALRAVNLYEEGHAEDALHQIENVAQDDARVDQAKQAHAQGDRDAALRQLVAIAAEARARLA